MASNSWTAPGVIPADIPGWPNDFQPSNRLTFGVPPRAVDALWWNEMFLEPHGLSPIGMAERLCQRLPGDKSFHYRSISHVSESFELEVTAGDEHGTLWMHSPVLELRSGWFLWDRLEKQPRYSGSRLAKSLASDLYETANLLGLTAIRIAAEDVGGYLWARAGFVPDVGSWIAITQYVVGRLVSVMRHLTPERIQQIQAILEAGKTDPSLICSLAALDDPIPPGHDPSRSGEPLELGKFLLAGARWVGTLQIRNTCEREEFKEWLKS